MSSIPDTLSDRTIQYRYSLHFGNLPNMTINTQNKWNVFCEHVEVGGAVARVEIVDSSENKEEAQRIYNELIQEQRSEWSDDEIRQAEYDQLEREFYETETEI